MKTANPKAGFGAVRHYQSGGLISSMKNMLGMKTETISEKYARQDAERAAKKAPPPVEVQPAAPSNAISQYASGFSSEVEALKAVAKAKKTGLIETKARNDAQLSTYEQHIKLAMTEIQENIGAFKEKLALEEKKGSATTTE